MKRLWVILGALAMVCALNVTVASAGQVAAHRAQKGLLFRSNAAANPAPGYIDSVYASGIAKFDTTVAFSLSSVTYPPSNANGIDSLMVLRLNVFDAGLASATLGQTSATAESIYIKTQVSADGVNWHDCAVIAGQAAVLNAWTVQTTVNAGVVTFTSSTNTGVAGKLWSMPFYAKSNAASLKMGLDIYHVHEFPFVRWILSGSRTLNHSWKANVSFWSTSDLD